VKTITTAISASAERRRCGLIVAGAQLHAVSAEHRLQFLGPSVGHDAASVDDRNAIALLSLVQVVGGEEQRRACGGPNLAQVGPRLRARMRIGPDRRLVEEQHARAVQQTAGDLQPALHPPGERTDHAVAPVIELDELQHGVDSPRQARPVQRVEIGVEAQVLQRGELGVERRLLEHQPDVAADRRRGRHRVESGHLDPTRSGVGERAEHGDRRGLSGSVGPQEAEDLTLTDREVDAAHRLHSPGKALAHRVRPHGHPVRRGRAGTLPGRFRPSCAEHHHRATRTPG